MPLPVVITELVTKTITEKVEKTVILSDNIEDYQFYGSPGSGGPFGGSPNYYVARHLETGYWRFFGVDGKFYPKIFRIPSFYSSYCPETWARVKVIPPKNKWKFKMIN